MSLCGPIDQLKVLDQDEAISKKSSAYALFIQGAIYENEGNLEEAEKIYLQALEYDSTEYMHVKYMDILLREGRLDDAVKQFEEIIKINPESTEAYVLKGQIDIMQKNYESAEKSFLKAIECGEDDFSIYISLAQLYITTDRNEKAIPMLEEALKLKPDNPIILFQAGMLYVKSGNHKKALEVMEKASTLKPEWIELHMAIAKLYETVKDYDNAISKYNEVLRLYPLNKSLLEPYLYF